LFFFRRALVLKTGAPLTLASLSMAAACAAASLGAIFCRLTLSGDGMPTQSTGSSFTVIFTTGGAGTGAATSFQSPAST
jgi:hypothetical protein